MPSERNATASQGALRGNGGVRDESRRESKSEFYGPFPTGPGIELLALPTGNFFCKSVHHYNPNQLRNWSTTCRSHKNDHIFREIHP